MSQQKTYSLDDLFLTSITGESPQYSVRNALNNPDMLPAAEIGKRDQAAEAMGTTYGEADAGWDDVSTEMQIRKAESVPNADKWVAESPENASFLDADSDALMAVYDDLQAQGFLTDQDIDRSTMQDIVAGGSLTDTLEIGRLANQRTDIGLAFKNGSISADEARSQLSDIDSRMSMLSERRSDPLGFYGFVEQGYRMLTRDIPQAGYRAIEGGLAGASAGAASGAILGTAVPVVGNLVGAGGGAAGGALIGAGAGLTRGMFESSRDMEEANFLADMLKQKDDAGQYLDEESIKNAAMLYGNLSALVEVGGDALSVAVLKYVSPAVKTAMAKLGVQSPKMFVKDAVKTAISNKSAWPALRRFVVGMGLGAAAEGAEEAVQEGISGQIEASTKNWMADLGVNYFREEQKGLLSGDTWAQMAEAGIEGAKVGAWFVLLPGVTQLAVDGARISRAREFASSVEKVTNTINATQTKQLSPVRMESFLKAQGLNQTVFIPADAAWQMQREGVDIAAPLGWEQQTLEEAAALGHDIAVPLARLEARLDADVMQRVAQILKEDPDSPSATQAQEPNLYLADDVEAINEAAAEWEFEQNILSHDIERLRLMLTEVVRSVPGLLKDLTSSADTETSVGTYVDSIVKLVENAEQRLAAYGGQTGAVVDDFMNRLQIQGLVRDEKGRARTPEEIEQAAMEEAQAQTDAPFWENVWGRIDPDSLKRDFPEARNELAKLHGRGLFARKGEGLPIDELADILKNAGWLPQDADSSTLVEMLKEKKTPARKEVGRGGHLYQQEPTNSFGVPMSRVTKIEGAVSREELDAALSALAGKDLPNLIEGVTAQVNANQRRKLESAKAGDKSMSNGFTRSEHQGVAARIANAWKWAAEAGRDGDKKNHMPDVGIRRYVSALNLNGDDAFAWITVKESSKGLRIYSVELMDNKKLRESVSSGAGKAATDALHRSFEEIILRLNTPVNEQKQALFQRAGRGAAYDSVDDDFMNRSQIQGIVRDEKDRAQANALFWENVWGRIDPDSLKRDFPDARNELAKLHGRGLFARKGAGLPIDELADMLKNAGWLPQDADSSTLVEMLKEKRRTVGGRRGRVPATTIVLNQNISFLEVAYPDGGKPVGEVTPEIAATLQLNKPGAIVLDETGIQHIRDRHGKELSSMGFSPEEFVDYVLRNFDAVYAGNTNNSYQLACVVDNPKKRVIIKLKFEEVGEYYRVSSAGPVRPEYYRKETPLWERAQSNHSITGTPDAISGQSGVA